MNCTNATIVLDVERLNLPCRPVYAKVGRAAFLRLENLPRCVASAYVRVFADVYGNDFADSPVDLGGSSAAARIPGSAFREPGSFRYEIGGRTCDGDDVALGFGTVEVGAFSDAPPPPNAGEF